MNPAAVPQCLITALQSHCKRYLSLEESRIFFKAARAVFEAFQDEVLYLQGQIAPSLESYLGIRSRSIALRPPLELIKHRYHVKESPDNNLWMMLEHEISITAGLQNDLIGLERDIEAGEKLNAVVVMLKLSGSDCSSIDYELLAMSVESVAREHNQSVGRLLKCASQLGSMGRSGSQHSEAVQHIVLLCETHLRWCAAAKRYRLKAWCA